MFDTAKVQKLCYRPFDKRFLYYDTGIVVRHRKEQIKHSLFPNIALLSGRQSKSDQVNHFFVTNLLSEMKTSESTTGSYHFPLYFYAEDGSKSPNLKEEIIGNIEKTVGKVSPEDIFDYIYSVLYSPSYREKYKEFLKIDFPRVPYPKDKKQFQLLIKLGEELKQLHLLESTKVNKLVTTYPVSGSDEIVNINYKDGKVFINHNQFFGKVPEIAWNFYIGGYQPAQKWLKDRKGRILTNEEIEHYQKMIVALVQTERIMKEIDSVISS